MDGIVQSDAREAIKNLDNESVDTVITSPPYFDLKDYDHQEQIGFGQSKEDYIDDLSIVFNEIQRVLKPRGSFWLIVDTYKREGDIITLPFQLADRVKETGLKLKEIVIWDKNRTLPWTKNGEMRNIFEYILVFSKQDDFKFYRERIKDPDNLENYWMSYPERYHPRGKTPSNIWNFDIPSQGAYGDDAIQHACPFPPELVERILLLTTDEGDRVLDPFAGTGTVLAQAEAMERNALGFELNDEYIENYHDKVKPKVEEEFGGDSTAIEAKQDKLEDHIINLRQLKLPKTIIRQLFKNTDWTEEDLPLLSVIALPQDGEPEEEYRHIFEKLILVHEAGIDVDRLKADVEEMAGSPPASKFGITPELEMFSSDEVDQIEPYFEGGLYLYTPSKFNNYKSRLSFEDWKTSLQRKKWKENFSNGVPPILSPIQVDVTSLENFM